MSTNKFAPMLASKLDPKHPLRFPLLASPKLDGIRAVVKDGVLLSRSLKPIPNLYCQKIFARPELERLDGELIVGPAAAPDVFQKTTSGVMRVEGEPAVHYFVFDVVLAGMQFEDRHQGLLQHIVNVSKSRPDCRLRVVGHEQIASQAVLDDYESRCLLLGYEGVMVRDPNGLYKHGRSTAKEGFLTKVKRFVDSEARIVGVEEQMHNSNEATVDALGHTERSSHKSGMVPMGTLGALVCETPEGIRFNIGTGYPAALRAELWAERDSLPGKLAKYKHFAATGVKDAPRFPVFLGLRHEADV